MANLIETGFSTVPCGVQLLFLAADQVTEEGEQLKITGRSDVVMTTEFL